MSNSNGLITYPVNTYDVASVTRKGSNDVGTLCGNNAMINKWAKYKPVRQSDCDTTPQLNSDKTWNDNYTVGGVKKPWWKANDGKCGFVLNPATTGTTLVTDWSTNWVYQPPRGGTVTPNEWYRLIDFNHYLHTAPAPVEVYALSIYYTSNDLVVNFQFYSGRAEQLTIPDFLNYGAGGVWPYTSTQEIYCGMLISYGNSVYANSNKAWATNPDAIGKDPQGGSSSQSSGKWSRVVTIPQSQCPTYNNNVPITIYPYLSTTVYNSDRVYQSGEDATFGTNGVIPCPVSYLTMDIKTSSISGAITGASCSYNSINSLAIQFTYTITGYGQFNESVVPYIYLLDADRDTSGEYSEDSKVMTYHIISYEDGYGYASGSQFPLSLADQATVSYNQNTLIGNTGTASLIIGCDAISYVNQYRTEHGTSKAYMRIGVGLYQPQWGRERPYVQTVFDNNGQGIEITGTY